jgi:hypothetical protein
MDTTAAAPDGETTITRMALREGGWIGYDDDAIFLRRAEGDDVKIRFEHVTGVSLRTLEWDLAIMSVLLMGVGAYVGATRNIAVGVGFGAIGVWSLYRTYAKRYQLVVHVEDEPNPVTAYPTHPDECRDRLGTVLRSEDPSAAGASETA